MRKYIEIPLEVLEHLVEGKYVEGSLHRDAWTGKIVSSRNCPGAG